jgi:pyruvate kinase
VEAVAMMDRIIREVEQDPHQRTQLDAAHPEPTATLSDAICCGLRRAVSLLNVSVAVTYTSSGFTSLRAARERPAATILSMSADHAVVRRMVLVWGVHSVLIREAGSIDDVVVHACHTAQHEGLACTGDILAITAGMPFGVSGTTNLLKLAVV